MNVINNQDYYKMGDKYNQFAVHRLLRNELIQGSEVRLPILDFFKE